MFSNIDFKELLDKRIKRKHIDESFTKHKIIKGGAGDDEYYDDNDQDDIDEFNNFLKSDKGKDIEVGDYVLPVVAGPGIAGHGIAGPVLGHTVIADTGPGPVHVPAPVPAPAPKPVVPKPEPVVVIEPEPVVVIEPEPVKSLPPKPTVPKPVIQTADPQEQEQEQEPPTLLEKNDFVPREKKNRSKSRR